ncbi:hypothetical protein RHMOL_Rhmol02G0169800 [Rhododendron molle]|uniref:Uncharacterized protein n=1 Tax=Rhododendron molle TaxID=49168 RepID=A0ACC0PQT6_RHOML|nr:hypothetical protein RHMOL_Rhmol02G0169800 [Rhododendron molle]
MRESMASETAQICRPVAGDGPARLPVRFPSLAGQYLYKFFQNKYQPSYFPEQTFLLHKK